MYFTLSLVKDKTLFNLLTDWDINTITKPFYDYISKPQKKIADSYMVYNINLLKYMKIDIKDFISKGGIWNG